jgi:mannitol-1-/sugar-/sorbitol-6-phosphatase
VTRTPIFDRSFSGFLFDMDGTIINSFAATQRAWGSWAIANGIDPQTFLPTMHGIRGVDLIGSMGRADLVPHVESAKVLAAEMDDVDGIVPIAGAIRFLSELPADRWAVVTSAPRDLARRRLEAAGITPPRTMVVAEDVAVGKPDPACFRLGAERLGLAPQDCLVFEDAHAGVTAAELAGTSVLVVTATHDLLAGTTHPTMGSYEDLHLELDGTERLTLYRRG